MVVDKFGNHIYKIKVEKVKSSCVLSRTIDGNIDVQSKILRNIQTPTAANDCATKQYVDDCINTYLQAYKSEKDIVVKLLERIKKLENAVISLEPKRKK